MRQHLQHSRSSQRAGDVGRNEAGASIPVGNHSRQQDNSRQTTQGPTYPGDPCTSVAAKSELPGGFERLVELVGLEEGGQTGGVEQTQGEEEEEGIAGGGKGHDDDSNDDGDGQVDMTRMDLLKAESNCM